MASEARRYIDHFKGKKDQTLTTPREFFARLDQRFKFTMDGAADSSNALLARYSSEGYLLSWYGERVFCNPPWGNIRYFIEQAPLAELAVFLVPARVNAKWFHRALELGAKVEYFCGKLKFGGCEWNSPVDCLLLVFGDAQGSVTEQSQQNPRQPSRLDAAIVQGKALGKKALYFGCWDRPGHFLHDTSGRTLYGKEKPLDLFWDEGLMDGGLLKNGKIPDKPDGRVFWTAGGLAYWYAFYWWDRSVDTRGACNSGFYVRGFGAHEEEAAFQYACEQFPHVVKRQKYPLVLQTKRTEQSQQKSRQDGEA